MTSPTQSEIQAVQALLMRGAVAEALPRAEALAARNPGDARLVNMLGIAQNLAGRSAEAEASFARAVGLDASHVGAHVNLANQYVVTGCFAEAEPVCRAALELDPPADNRAKLTYLLATALAGLGRASEAEEWFRAAVAQNPDQAQAHLGLVKVLAKLTRYAGAWAVAAPAGQRWPDDPELARVRAQLLVDLNRTAEALELLEGWRDRMDSYPGLHLVMGKALGERQRPTEAAAHCRRALELMPQDFAAWAELGKLESELGHRESALEALDRAQALRPDYVPVMALRQELAPAAPGTPDYEAIRSAFEATDGEDWPRAVLGMALYRTHDRLGETDTAFDYLTRAKAIRSRARPYDMKQALEVFAALKAQFSPPVPALDAMALAAMPAAFRPVFIVGMPRSGTTLVEQILASHSAVFGGGEMPALGTAMARQRWNNLSVGAAVTPDMLADVRADYLRFVEAYAPGAAVVTDKTPLNFRWLGIALAALPEARVLFMQRDARATCFSNFGHHLAGSANDFGNDLGNTVQMYRAHLDLKAFWEATFPGRIVTVDYERLTKHQEEESRKLVAAAGLDWEPACLEFHQTDRLVSTASSEQVRQKIYTGSSEKWRRYEAHLGPMLAGLEGL